MAAALRHAGHQTLRDTGGSEASSDLRMCVQPSLKNILTRYVALKLKSILCSALMVPEGGCGATLAALHES